MASTAPRSRTSRSRGGAKRRRTRERQAFAFLAGAALVYVLVARDRADFNWLPLALGAVYLAVAVAGGPDGGHWPTACVLLGWGLGVVVSTEPWGWDQGQAPSYLLVAGAGLALAAALERALDVPMPTAGLAGALVLGAGVFLLQDELDLVQRAWVFPAGLALVGLANVALARRGA